MAGNACELNLPRVCEGIGTWVHHIWPQRAMRRTGVWDDSIENIRWSCDSCNQQVESMGQQSAAELGLYSAEPLGQAALDALRSGP